MIENSAISINRPNRKLYWRNRFEDSQGNGSLARSDNKSKTKNEIKCRSN